MADGAIPARWTASDIPDQSGKTFLITGANSGLGLEATRALAARGATVVMACRSKPKVDEAMAAIRAQTPSARLEFLSLDLSSLASIRAAAEASRARFPKLDALINNAGIMAIPLARTAEGLEMQLGTNHFGHFALTGLLLPTLSHDTARIVTVASMAHRMGKMDFSDLQWQKGYERWAAYGRSKLANLLFTRELSRRLTAAGRPTLALAAHPGYSATNLQLVSARIEGSSFSEAVYSLGNKIFAQSAEKGALPELFAAVHPSVRTGDYIGPNGFMEVWGYPTRVVGNARSQSDSDARQLWDVSVQTTGVDFGGL